MKHRKTRLALATLCIFLGLAGNLAGQHPNHPQGFSADRLYHGGLDQIDYVDLFTGTLAITLPIGPFTLSYNSNVWRYEQVVDGGLPYIWSYPDRRTTGGLGWHLGMGEVYSPSHHYNQSGQWMYVDGDGGRHLFYQELHRGENENDSTVLYTRDNSYLRLRYDNNFWVDIEFGDGTTQRFNSGTGGLGTVYRLEQVWSPYGSVSSPDMSVTYVETETTEERTVVDRYGRTHYILLQKGLPWINRVVTQVDVESFAGQRSVYDFTYETVPVDVSCKDNYPGSPNRISVPHLVRIDLPDGTAYSMKENSQRLYHNSCNGGIEDLPGALQGLWLPTGGKLAWTYQEYEFPPGEGNSPFNSSVGVASRSMVRPSSSGSSDVWAYRSTSRGPQNDDDPEMMTEVVYPTGDCTRHFFNARYYTHPSQGRGWEYGLPFTYRFSSGGQYLSREVWDGHSANGACSGQKLRSSYVRFRKDQLPGANNYPLWHWYDVNRTLEANRAVFHDDGDRWVASEKSDFDGLGNFRRTVSTGNLWSGSGNQERRERVVNYNKVSGNYPGSFTPIPPSEPWVLAVFDQAQASEPDAHGSSTRKVEYVFDRNTGAMECERALATGTSRSSADVVTRETRNTLGQVVASERWGGDGDPIPTTGGGCGNTPGAPTEKVVYRFEHGVRVQAEPVLPSGQKADFDTYDVDVDPSTGLITRSRSATGQIVDYQYDNSGRLRQAQPLGLGRTVYDYFASTAARGPEVRITQYASSGSLILQQSAHTYDHFGRLWKQQRRLPNGTWIDQRTQRNGRGWTLSISEWGNPSKTTQFLDHDPFGRARRVRPPSGSSHDVLYTFEGQRSVTRRAKVAMIGGEAYADRIEERDAYGRLRTLREPSGAGGNMVPTTYRYNVNNQLTQTRSGTSPVQVRSWNYSNHGFLLSQTMPEKGVSGNGTVTYSSFDARGNPERKTDGPNRLQYAYDDLGRMTSIRDLNQGSRLVSEFFYDDAAGAGDGQLWYTVQHNWVDLPWNSTGVEDVQVRETYSYQGPGGAVSKRQTRYTWGSREVEFEHTYHYNDLGQLARVGYPRCVTAVCAQSSAGSGRNVDYRYAQGQLTEVVGWANLSYASSGLWNQLTHADGSKDIRTFDPNYSRRPRRLQTLAVDGVNLLYDTGVISYDGSGNPKSAGSGTYRYDGVGRLVRSVIDPPLGNGPQRQDFAYDTFGNMTSRATTWNGGTPQTVTFGTSSATNRLSAGSYDGAGNLVSWGGRPFTYNTSNRLTSAAWMRYLYNAAGERVGAFANHPSEHMHFIVRNEHNRVLSEMYFAAGDGYVRRHDYVWAGTQLLGKTYGASTDPADQLHMHLDLVGSVRVVSQGGYLQRQLDFQPYGERLDDTGEGDEHLYHYAGHERTHSSGLDSMHARFYSSELARFLSVDPSGGSPAVPQSVNRYGYAMGNPVRWVDPDGRDVVASVVVLRGDFDPGYHNPYTLEVLQHVGQHAPAMRAMEQSLALMATLPIAFELGATWSSLGWAAAGGAGISGASHYVASGFDTAGLLPAMFEGATRGVILGVAFGTSTSVWQGAANMNQLMTVFRVSANAAAAAASAQNVYVTEGGLLVIELVNGGTVIYDKEGNLVSRGETVEVNAVDPGEQKDESSNSESNSASNEDRPKWWESPPLTQERADWSIDQLRSGRCIVDPITCIGGGGGGGFGRIVQYY